MTPERKCTCATSPATPVRDRASWRAADNLHHALFVDEQSRHVSPGEIWSVRAVLPAEEQLLLAVISTVPTQSTVTVIPLSDEARLATEWDLIVPQEVLGYPVVAQAKLTGTIATEQLTQRLSSLPERLFNELGELSAAAEEGASVPPAHLPVGPWVHDEADERLRARAQKAQALVAYLRPAYEDPLSEWGSFGGILVRSSRAQGTSIETLVDEVWAQAIQEDQVDLFNRVPARRLARLITDLQIAWNERVRQTLKNAVRATLTPSEVVHGAALGRRRGARSRSKQRARASPEEADRAASEYVASVEKALKDQ